MLICFYRKLKNFGFLKNCLLLPQEVTSTLPKHSKTIYCFSRKLISHTQLQINTPKDPITGYIFTNTIKILNFLTIIFIFYLRLNLNVNYMLICQKSLSRLENGHIRLFFFYDHMKSITHNIFQLNLFHNKHTKNSQISQPN